MFDDIEERLYWFDIIKDREFKDKIREEFILKV